MALGQKNSNEEPSVGENPTHRSIAPNECLMSSAYRMLLDDRISTNSIR